MLCFLPHRWQLAIVVFGIPATLMFDLLSRDGATANTAVYTMAFVPRVLTYVILFASFVPMAQKIAAAPYRAREAAVLWFLASVLVAVFAWAWMGRIGQISTDALKIYAPGAMAQSAQATALAEVAIGPEAARLYRWDIAILAQIFALSAAANLAALFVHACAVRDRHTLAMLTPVVATMALVLYAGLVPWVFTLDASLFIGDVLVGGLLLNILSGTHTLVWGGVTAPAVWINVLALANLLLLRHWGGSLAEPDPDR